MSAPWLDNSVSLQTISDGSILGRCDEIANDITEKRISLLQLVTSLDSALTHSDSDFREKGIRILGGTLYCLPKNFLNSEQLLLICEFLNARLSDHHSVVPAVLDSILAIVHMTYLPEEWPSCILKTMFDNVPCQGQTPGDRIIYYSIIRECIKSKLRILELKADLVYGFISAMDGERDPKCLALVFQMFPELAQATSLFHLTEDVFDILSAYFPIDFTAQIPDTMEYSRNNLARLLNKCLVATADFAEFTIPLALEKLQSDLRVAKFNSLDLLIDCTEHFKDKDFSEHLDSIWPVLRYEIKVGTNMEIRKKSLEVLHHITRVLDNSLETFVQTIVTSVSTMLHDPNSHLFQSSINVLLVTASASPRACSNVCDAIIPKLFLLDITVKSTIPISLLIKESVRLGASLKEELKQSVYDRLLKAFNTDDVCLKIAALEGLSACAIDLPQDVRVVIYSGVINSIKETDNNDVCFKMMNYLQTLCNAIPDEAITFILPQLEFDSSSPDSDVNCKILQILCKLSFVPQLAHSVLTRLIDLAIGDNLFLSHIALKNINENILEASDEINWKNTVTDIIENCQIIDKIKRWLLSHKSNEIPQNVRYDETLQYASRILKGVMLALSKNQQQDIVQSMTCDCCTLLPQDVAVYTGVLCNLKRSVNIPRIEELVTLLLNPCGINVNTDYGQLLCSVINKAESGEQLEKILSMVEIIVKDKCHDEEVLKLWSWLCKALLLRAHEKYLDWTREILQMSKTSLGVLRLEGFDILFLDYRPYDCNIKYLYHQRLYQAVFPELVNTTGDIRQQCLVVLNRLIKSVPASIVNINTEKIMPVFIESITSSEPTVVNEHLQVLQGLLKSNSGETSSELYQKIDIYLPKLLMIAQNDVLNNRLLALECVGLYAGPTVNLPKRLLFKQDVTVALKFCLSDYKRLVRNAAIAARELWFNIDTDI